MGYSIRDLENAGKNLNRHFEERAEQRGEELADRLLASTAAGRGLWFVILWPAWFIVFSGSGALFAGMLLEDMFGWEKPLSYLGLIPGFFIARQWYRWRYTILHPFLSSLLVMFVIPIILVMLSAR
jgi:hypothetical protein